jgi:hypothetical protein
MDWPLSLAGAPMVVTGPMSRDSVAIGISTSPASTAWPTANTAVYIPFRVFAPFLVAQIAWANGSAVSGNIDAGIYDAVGTRLVSAGSTVQSGAAAVQTVDITDTWIGPGLFYLALALDNTTGTITGQAAGLQRLRAIGLVEMASAFPLPATATFAALTGNLLPLVCATSRSVL